MTPRTSATNFGEVLGKVVLDGIFVLLPVIAVMLIGVEKLVKPEVDHAVVFELMLGTLILFADVIREIWEKKLSWKRRWRILRAVAGLSAILGLFAVGVWFGATTHPLTAAVLAGSAAITWFLVKMRVVYSEDSQRRFLIAHFWKA